jgi:hypothetical protein
VPGDIYSSLLIWCFRVVNEIYVGEALLQLLRNFVAQTLRARTKFDIPEQKHRFKSNFILQKHNNHYLKLIISILGTWRITCPISY